MNRLVTTGLMFALAALQGCQKQEVAETKDAAVVVPQQSAANIYSFMESEPGIDPYPVRMIVTDSFMRIDEGNTEDNFLLFNRKDNSIHSVTHEDQTILRIARKSRPIEVPESVDLGVKENVAAEMPKFAGQSPIHQTFTSDGKACYDVVGVQGYGEDAVSAMREYLLTLSGEQVRNLDKTPPEMRDDCMMANLIYAPVRHLEVGFPLREWDYKGYVRELVNTESQEIDPELMNLDPAYKIYELAPSGMPALVN